MSDPTPQLKSEELRFEYDQLRHEILLNDQLILQILGTTVAFVAAIAAVTWSGPTTSNLVRALLFLLAEAISILGFAQSINRAETTLRIASYLRTFVEPQLNHLRWETRLDEFWKPPDKRYPFLFVDQLVPHVIMIIATSASTCIYLYLGRDDVPAYPNLPITASAGLLIGTGLYLWYALDRYKKTIKDPDTAFGARWRALREYDEAWKAHEQASQTSSHGD